MPSRYSRFLTHGLDAERQLGLNTANGIGHAVPHKRLRMNHWMSVSIASSALKSSGDSALKECLTAMKTIELPSTYENLRRQRFRGEGFESQLSVLSPLDQSYIRSLYNFAKGLHACWVGMHQQPDWGLLQAKITSLLSPPLSVAATTFGRDSLLRLEAPDGETALGKLLHDLRGGALMPLMQYAQMMEEDLDPLQLRSAVLLARDQARIMRSILPDLDPEARLADEAEKPHHIEAVIEKWSQFLFERQGQVSGRVSIHCTYRGQLTSCCLEASAVDRIVYNYVNNATRFSAGPVIQMSVTAVGERVVRWMVANRVPPDQEAWLRERTQGDLSHLFRGGVTRDGQGLGLSNCADFVAAAFGLNNIDEAIGGKYLGATVRDGVFVAWAHWPSFYTHKMLAVGPSKGS